MIPKIYIKPRFYILASVIILIFILSYGFPFLLTIGKSLLFGLFLAAIVDLILVRRAVSNLDGKRMVNSPLSLGDYQEVMYEITNDSDQNLDVSLVDELPVQLQYRHSIGKFHLDGTSSIERAFQIRPTVRGEYKFGNLFAFISMKLPGLLEYRETLEGPVSVDVYPSVIQMKKYELQLSSKTAHLQGIKKVRMIGQNDEFEQIKPYVPGDNLRAINWKATSRKQSLMVNHYQDSKSQMVYCIVDSGRAMRMPFFNLSLLDHAVNTALVLSNIVLTKHDKIGLITFSKKIGTILKASSQRNQLKNVMKRLFKLETNFQESNFELLFYTIRRHIQQRSILIMYTNFEQSVEVDRNLKYLRAISKLHLLIIVIFKNTALEEAAGLKAVKKSDIYLKTLAEKALVEKEEIKMRLESNGIQCVLTKPENLSLDVINKYLEIKSKRMK